MLGFITSLREKLGGGSPPPPLEVLLADPLVQEGLTRAHAGFGAGVREMVARMGEIGLPPNKHIQAIGGYKVLRELGRGGMGTVFLAENDQGKHVVIKVPFSELGADPKYVEIFFREFQALSTARHENIVRVFRYGRDTTHNVYYYVAEFVNGLTLKEYLDAHPAKLFSATEAAAVTLAMVRAIRFLRGKNVTHRDLKPGNIMFDVDGRVKLIDFGAAKIAGENSELTNAGVLMGTFDYLAPEAGLEGAKAVGQERDIFALGIIHYRMLKGRLPHVFGGGREGAITFGRFAESRKRPLSDLRGLDRLSKRLLLQLTERNPQKRLVDFDQIERWLAQIVLKDPARAL
ncbi:MAG: serine/threonine protein kinase [Deltaproteobacteria bacterium]|nr:serine/threonine protein kinase [Deltaproteobacteria bacterium]